MGVAQAYLHFFLHCPSSCLCALRRFFAILGPALRLRCDRDTNFVCAKTEIDEAVAEMDKESVAKYISEQGCEWIFNPPHTSHYGRVWERQIGTIWRILDAMLLELGTRQLTHELLVTLMSEVAAIVNARPITALPSDIDEPQPLTPAMLLTQKTRPLCPLPGNFMAQDVYANGDGGKFSTWLINFGPDGDGSISTICRRERSGTSSVGT